jgi:hypothetical protein
MSRIAKLALSGPVVFSTELGLTSVAVPLAHWLDVLYASPHRYTVSACVGVMQHALSVRARWMKSARVSPFGLCFVSICSPCLFSARQRGRPRWFGPGRLGGVNHLRGFHHVARKQMR